MSATDDKHYRPRRFRDEVNEKKVHKESVSSAEPAQTALTEPEENEVEPYTEPRPVPEPEPAPQKDADEEAAAPSAQEESKADSKASASSEPDLVTDQMSGEEGYSGKTAVMPHEKFEYVVPHETFKQHMSRKHETVHKGATKSATDQEIADAESGFIFQARRKHKKHRKHHHHHHHHHRHHRFRHLKLWKRILIVFVAVILILALLLTGTFFILREIGRRSLLDYEDTVVVMPDADEDGNEIVKVDRNGSMITYDGVSYELNKNIIKLVVIGADEGKDEINAQDEEEQLETGLLDSAKRRTADAINIIAVDTESGSVKILGVSRDTMTDVDVYSDEGNFISTDRLQIALSYSYTSDEVTGARNTCTSLDRLFYGMDFEDYFAINMEALITLNDTIGGVTLTSSMTFTSPIDGRTITKGEEVTLHGKEADYYVRYRETSKLSSNSDRMQRQQEYIQAFMSSIIPAAKKDLSIVTKLYNEIKVNSDTTLGLPEITYLASTALTKLRSAKDIQYFSLEGTYSEGVYAEYNVTNKDTIRTMLNVFYTPIGALPEND